MTLTIVSIGHSTRKIEDFIRILKMFEIQSLADIRTIPKSRRNPQFSDDNLSSALNENNITYEKIKSLGGLRKPRKDSINLGWRNESFRGYADYMQTPDFEAGLNELITLGKKKPTAMMCAEAVPWRCHRSLVGDALLVRGIEVIDIIDLTNSKRHELTKFAAVDGERITYPKTGPETMTLD